MSGAPAGSFSLVAAGDQHACAITTSNALKCWFVFLPPACSEWRNFVGEISRGNIAAFGIAASPTGTWSRVSSGASFSCGITGTGQVGALACIGSGAPAGIPSGTDSAPCASHVPK